MKDPIEVALEVAQGNPGAIQVIKELQWFNHWYEMMCYCLKNKIVGPELWILYKDKYHKDIMKLGYHLQKETLQDKEFEHFNNEDPNYHKIPKFK